MQLDLPQLYAASEAVWQATLAPVLWDDLSAALTYLQPLGSHARRTEALLPALCCAAVGGDPQQAVALNAGWQLYLLGAGMFDDVVDDDRVLHAKPWQAWAVGRIVNVAATLYIGAQACLCQSPLTSQLNLGISQALLQASQAQADPPRQAPELTTYYRYVTAKSGAVYAAFTQAGAQLGTAEPALWRVAFELGLALGLLRQLQNDIGNVTHAPYAHSDLAQQLYTLPVLCALAQTEHAQWAQFEQNLRALPTHPDPAVLYAVLQAQWEALGALEASWTVVAQQRAQAHATAHQLPQPPPALLSLLDL